MGLRKCYLDPMVQVMINHFSDLHGKLMLELGDQVISDEDVSEKTGKEYFGNLGIHHASFDLNGLHGAIPVDLSRPVNNPEWKNHFDIVTNAGTIEHVEPKIGQYECFRNVHNWMKTGGISIHLAPDIDELEKYGAGEITVIITIRGNFLKCSRITMNTKSFHSK